MAGDRASNGYELAIFDEYELKWFIPSWGIGESKKKFKPKGHYTNYFGLKITNLYSFMNGAFLAAGLKYNGAFENKFPRYSIKTFLPIRYFTSESSFQLLYAKIEYENAFDDNDKNLKLSLGFKFLGGSGVFR